MRAANARLDLPVDVQGVGWPSADPSGDAEQIVIDAHRGGAGPYIAAAALIRRIIDADPAAARGFSPAHALTVLAVAPDLAPRLVVSDMLAASLSVSREGNAPTWTLRVANGLCDIVLAHVTRAAPRRIEITFLNLIAADPLDREFISLLLRRAEPEGIWIHVQFGGEPSPRPAPADRDTASLLSAAKHCMERAYYEAALDCALRGRRELDPEDRGKAYAEFTRHVIFASLLLGRLSEVEQICRQLQPDRDDPGLLAHATYAMAILNARLYEPSRHDYEAAKGWIEQSLTLTRSLPDSETRAVNIAFLHNTMALVQMREGRPKAALALLNSALRLMARTAPNKYRAESTILLHNRARLRVAMCQPDAAIADLTRLLRQEPSDSDAYVDRGLLHQRAGRHAAALDDYDAAIAWSPPFEAAHFNRAQTLSALGRAEDAERDYDRVLELNPENLDAHINRACLRLARNDHDGAGADVDRSLERAPGNARALCLRGLLELAGQEPAKAHGSFAAAIAADPLLADAWANRASASFRQGNAAAALEDLTASLELREDPIVLCNRAKVFESEDRWSDARADYARALEIAPGLHGAQSGLRICRERIVGAPGRDDPRRLNPV